MTGIKFNGDIKMGSKKNKKLHLIILYSRGVHGYTDEGGELKNK